MPNQAKDDKASSGPSKSSSSSASSKGANNSASQRGQTVSSSKPSSSGGNNSASQRGATVSSSKPSASSSVSKPSVSSSKSSFAGQERSGTGRSYSPASQGGAQNSASQRGAVVSASRPSPQGQVKTGFASAYRQVADTARSVGVTSIGGAKTPAQPSFRQSEVASMKNMDGMYADAKKSLLDTIAGPESAGRYDVMYGGSRFTDFSKHPGQYVTITSGPNKGKKSSAAGKYQFLESTWNSLADDLGLKDFSPASQDAAAFEYARREYQRKTGLDLEKDLVSQDPQKISSIARNLSGKWTSLPGGIEQGITSKQFVQSFTDKYMGPTIPDRPTNVGAGLMAGLPSSGPAPASPPQPAQQTAYVDPMVVKVDAPTKASPSFKEKYLSTPEAGPTPAAKPQTQVAEAPKELTTGQKIAAGAIDIGAGFIPVVGTGLGVVNAGLQLTGNQTIGERIVAGLGDNQYVPDSSRGQDRDYQSVAEASTMNATANDVSASYDGVIIPTFDRFVNTYLGPTPEQKWARA